MFTCLSPGAIGIRGVALPDALELAQITGFEGLEFDIREASKLATAHGVTYVRDLFAQSGVRPGHWGLPVAWNNDAQWETDLAALPALAALARDLGCTRTATWCPPASDERDYAENFAWHVARFRPIAQVLKDHGCRLGIEFIGPKTLRAPRRYPFIYTLEGMMELVDAIGTGNVGLLFDAFHLYTSGGSLVDMDTITADDVVVVHVNDAPAGIERDAQIDNVRCLPMETGIVDAPGMLRKLAAMGYDGPVTPEPFSQRVNAIAAEDPLHAAQIIAQSMDALWQASGLS